MPTRKKQTAQPAITAKEVTGLSNGHSRAAKNGSEARIKPVPASKAAGSRKTVSKAKSAGAKTKMLRRIIFQVRFHTEFGQEVFLSGDHPLLGDKQPEKAISMQYFDDQHWYAVIDTEDVSLPDRNITYNYFLKNTDGSISFDWGADKSFNPAKIKSEELVCLDAWNYAGYYENSFYTEPFLNVLLKENHTRVKTAAPRKATHVLRTKTPLLAKGQTLCVLGNCDLLGNWDTDNPVLMSRKEDDDAYEVAFDLSEQSFPIAYKYGVYDTVQKQFVRYEDGDNRVLHDSGKPNRLAVLHDGWAVLPANTWKGAGIAIPVFSLRTENSFGIGEFNDLQLLVDWAKKTGLKMIQLLPVNDTTATHSWMDSYPYAAISAFALHPVYLNLEKITDKKGSKRLQKLQAEKKG